MKVAVIGQSAFGSEVYKELVKQGHTVVGVFTIPDTNGREDILATTASKDNVKVFKIARWKALIKDGGHVLSDVLETYKSVEAEVNVLAFVTQFIPMEVIDAPKHGSIVYHPSLLPAHRGASAINWTLMNGDKKGGFTVFWADDGLDTGPILLQKECDVGPDETLNEIYKRFLFPEGVKGIVESVNLIKEGKAPKIVQPKEGLFEWNNQVASYDKLWKDKNLAKIDWNQPAQTIHNFIRGNDRVPGAWTKLNGETVTLYGSHYLGEFTGEGTKYPIDDTDKSAIQTQDGLIFAGSDGNFLSINLVQVGAKTMPASSYGKTDTQKEGLVLSDSEKSAVDKLKQIWQGILNNSEITDATDFFVAGAASMDVTRLISNIKTMLNTTLEAEQIYLNTSLGDMKTLLVRALRGENSKQEIAVPSVKVQANGMTVNIPYQLFINGKFVNAADGKTYETINPTTEEVICPVAFGGKSDVDEAVKAAKSAFDMNSPWRKMSARDRGTLLYKLADLLEQNKEEMATIESLDSGAVYTLALKTHVGMSIDTFRYFAGWCDKIQGSTIPISNARPNFNLCFTKREPIGPCGIVIPWNYPLMMLAWKTAACLAAGNTVVIKPAQVTPLTALKWAELSMKAGFPPGVINVVSGSGTIVGEAIATHPDIRKLGFTGSTEVGKVIMKSAAVSNLKKVSLELGGKSPLIIFGDCDMDKAVRASMSAVFFNKGENCIAAGRLFVEEKIHDEFVKRVTEEAKKMVIGDPFEPSTSHGPQNHKAHLNKLLSFVQTATNEGGKLVYGGKRVEKKGFFLEPTIITEVRDGTFAAKEESFGPIMIISKFDGDVDKVLKRANDTEFGLSSGVFTRDMSKALRVADGLEAGTCYINTYNKTDVASPFGGFKQSGFGKDLGEDALHEYLKTKAVTIEY